jgi:membrane protease YdiL (CAAX protease family)
VRFAPYIFLTAAIVSLWLTRGFNRLITLAAFLTLAIGSGFVAGVLSPAALLPIAVFAALCWAYSLRLPDAMRVPLAIAVVVASLGLMAHAVPGFANLLIVEYATVSQDAPPFTLYLNFDKALIGLFLLAFAMPLIASRAESLAMLRAALPRIIVVIGVVLVAAIALRHVRFDPKWPEFFPFWAWSNLLFTCTAEEAVFRGVIQRTIAGDAPSTRRTLAALLIAAVLFGVVHFAGGPRSVMMATLAGAGYGWVYWRGGNRIEASILAHFLLNVTQILFFTYPALNVAAR